MEVTHSSHFKTEKVCVFIDLQRRELVIEIIHGKMVNPLYAWKPLLSERMVIWFPWPVLVRNTLFSVLGWETPQTPWTFCSCFESYKSEAAGFVSHLTVTLSLIKLYIDTASNSNWSLSSAFGISSLKKARTNSWKFLEKLLIAFHSSICLLLPSHSETRIYSTYWVCLHFHHLSQSKPSSL